ncbi:MAG: inorganic phosphate transporter [Clostridia bacterium]|nr:inorganic phosphate transporter [Clostridia bacterium]
MVVFFTVLIFLLVLVNGWTDAPNAIASCVGTRSLSPRSAVALAAVCNFAGASFMTLIHTGVAETLFGLSDFGSDPSTALRALCAALLTVILWGMGALFLGLPTSESHALIASMSGAALALRWDLSVIGTEEWKKILLGLFLSTLPACLLGFLLDSVLRNRLRHLQRRQVMGYFSRAQRVSAAGNALLHGAQDSQKFMGVYLLGLSLLGRSRFDSQGIVPLPLALSVAAVMGLGTLLGGSRIIKKVGCDMVRSDPLSGSASDAASALSLTLCFLLGLPASTTHSKTCAMMGTCLFRKGKTNLSVALQLLAAWVLTFPSCAILGFLLTRLFL